MLTSVKVFGICALLYPWISSADCGPNADSCVLEHHGGDQTSLLQVKSRVKLSSERSGPVIEPAIEYAVVGEAETEPAFEETVPVAPPVEEAAEDPPAKQARPAEQWQSQLAKGFFDGMKRRLVDEVEPTAPETADKASEAQALPSRVELESRHASGGQDRAAWSPAAKRVESGAKNLERARAEAGKIPSHPARRSDGHLDAELDADNARGDDTQQSAVWPPVASAARDQFARETAQELDAAPAPAPAPPWNASWTNWIPNDVVVWPTPTGEDSLAEMGTVDGTVPGSRSFSRAHPEIVSDPFSSTRIGALAHETVYPAAPSKSLPEPNGRSFNPAAPEVISAAIPHPVGAFARDSPEAELARRKRTSELDAGNAFGDDTEQAPKSAATNWNASWTNWIPPEPVVWPPPKGEDSLVELDSSEKATVTQPSTARVGALDGESVSIDTSLSRGQRRSFSGATPFSGAPPKIVSAPVASAAREQFARETAQELDAAPAPAPAPPWNASWTNWISPQPVIYPSPDGEDSLVELGATAVQPRGSQQDQRTSGWTDYLPRHPSVGSFDGPYLPPPIGRFDALAGDTEETSRRRKAAATNWNATWTNWLPPAPVVWPLPQGEDS